MPAAADNRSAPRIALIHALAASVEPIAKAFSEHWPEARTFNLLDDSLSRDRQADGELTAGMRERFLTLGRYAAAAGSRHRSTAAILFTCSAFGPAIQTVKDDLPIPVLNPNEGAFETALSAGQRIALLVTFPPSAESLRTELLALAKLRGIRVDVKLKLVEGALAALAAGNAEQHDVLIAEAAGQADNCDVIVLGQFSMARAAARVSAATGARVVTTPNAAVKRLRTLLEA
jgi:Asp/Glu/hydantoin racemase